MANTQAVQEYTEQELHAYHLEFERLIERVSSSLTHYEVLGLDQLATGGEIKCAYLRCVALLNPSQLNLNLSVPADSLDKADQSFERVSRAFATLISFQRRTEYDDELRWADEGGSFAQHKTVDVKPGGSVLPPRSDAVAKGEHLSSDPAPVEHSQPHESPDSPQGQDRRSAERFRLSIPVIITGHDRRKGEWKEISRTIDVSRSGVLLELRRPIRNGRVLHMAMPMPAELREGGNYEPGYCVYGLVRRVEPAKQGRRIVGLELLGEQPPDDFKKRPWAIFDVKTWTGAQRRRNRREEKAEPITIQYLSQTMELLRQEESVTENVSAKGLRVFAAAIPSDFELVRVCSTRKHFESLAAVSNRYLGEDGRERLCLRLLENKWPL